MTHLIVVVDNMMEKAWRLGKKNSYDERQQVVSGSGEVLLQIEIIINAAPLVVAATTNTMRLLVLSMIKTLLRMTTKAETLLLSRTYQTWVSSLKHDPPPHVLVLRG